MKRGILLLVLSVLLIGFAYADSISFSPITGNSVISTNSGTAPEAINNNLDAKSTGIGISVLFPFVAPLIIQYNLFNAFLNNMDGSKITGNDIISIGPTELQAVVQNDLVNSSDNNSDASITESDNLEENESEDEIENETKVKTDGSRKTEIKSNIEEKLREREKTKITANIIGTQSKVQIREMFYTTSTNKDEIIAEIISKFSLDKDTASSLLKIETEDESEDDLSNEEEIEKLKIEADINSKFSRIIVEKKFILNTIDKDEILNSIVSESQLTAEEIKNSLKMKNIREIIKERNRIKFTNKAFECPLDCTCAGSTIKCTLASGREMTITAGNSGNVIVQIKGENMTTNVTLYKSDDKVYGVFSGNETREVKVLPDQVKESLRAKLKAKLQDKNITLNEDGSYEYDGEKQARLFFIIPVKVAVKAEIDSETGEITNIEGKWWSFLAKDEQ